MRYYCAYFIVSVFFFVSTKCESLILLKVILFMDDNKTGEHIFICIYCETKNGIKKKERK